MSTRYLKLQGIAVIGLVLTIVQTATAVTQDSGCRADYEECMNSAERRDKDCAQEATDSANRRIESCYDLLAGAPKPLERCLAIAREYYRLRLVRCLEQFRTDGDKCVQEYIDCRSESDKLTSTSQTNGGGYNLADFPSN